METIPVIFRRDKRNGEIVACFPTIAANIKGTTFSCYSTVGQHGSFEYDWYKKRTVSAKESEYLDLYEELKQIYNDDETELEITTKFKTK